MTNVYIRDTKSMKAAPAANEEAFREANPDGKFVYFDVETGKLVPSPSLEEEVVKPDVIEVDEQYEDYVDDSEE